ncbi:MAG: helix-turn-helix domain-containing protein [Hyphomonas sp.]|uniref:helix-turn-helix domain-containing protein n=1 Tax=Hyphomonas sp. TaxID=87 RepID=UPI0017F64CFD|nr:helix-turn-helix domain-containing protein [Hyphomonas sp.]MBA3070167.1 helix-turn-helix domain-containing protein [Hyphomonas sp.]MBU3920122.1 helix-turn-helix domain-containing protein [Alphaproteobacteria bacterium]MBU4060257.1 helix-turn-helix domain-containing protein [Alphaproteobacteria bacterium]MBU4162925.1 helix-turn-helix domain-containing protein [Alphaproteobacteria bacterium]
MSDAYKSIRKGLEESLAHAKGKKTGARVHAVTVADPDVAAIRTRAGLSQAEFARSIGVAVGTLRGWEQGRRKPDGPARVLLALIEKRPRIVQDELR